MLHNGHIPRIKKVLTSEWKPTSQIVKEAHVHYYKTVQILDELLSQGVVELDRKSDRFSYWRLKQ